MDDLPLDLSGSRILVVDDVPANLDVLRQALEAAGYQVMVAASGEVALALATRFLPELILLDVVMPGIDGFETCRRLKQGEGTRPIPVIFLTARDDTAGLVEGFRAGGADYVAKPFQKEEVLARLQTQLERARLLRELAAKNTALEEHTRQLAEKNRALEEEMAQRQRLTSERDELADRVSRLSQLEIDRHGVAGFIGQSRAVQAVLEEIALLQQAHTVSVLITGESGTGKEGIARAIHSGGTRARGPFVAVNCAAIPRELAESSFFGRARGAFTGAYDTHRGYFEQADGGTLFLDEVGDLPLELQAKLLRILETGRAVPPLRQRREDIPLLVAHFLRLFAAEMGRESPGLSREALSVLEEHEFPGNVRELKNLIEYALIRSRGALIRPEHLRFIEFRKDTGGVPEESPTREQGRPNPQEGRFARAEEQIRAYVTEHGSISNTECRDLLSIDLQRASYLLKKLHAQGLLERQGARRWSRYRFPPPRS